MTMLLSALAGDPEIENLLSDEAQLAAMLAFEAALAEASGVADFIPDAAAVAISSGINSFSADWADLASGMARDGVPIPALISQLRRHLPAEVAPHLHKGATSQDVIDTALMLQLARVFDVYDARLNAVLEKLGTLQGEHGHKPLVAHTRMQVALPTTWDAKFRSWSEPLARALRALLALRKSLLVIQLGGPVGDRASFSGHGEAIAAHMARSLDLGLASPWHTQRDQIVALGSLLVQISGSLGKAGLDIALLSQNEIAAVRLLGGGTSSAMAHKSNPVKAEVLVALAHFIAGLCGTLNLSMLHENERSGTAWTLEWLTLPRMLVATGASLNLALEMFDQLSIPDPTD
jgi:3-carboxy-cis,cis-muconate cycloisomerase